MDTNRIRINNYDLSTTDASADSSVVGYTVVKAPKGGIIPRRIHKGDYSSLQNIYGLPSKDFPDLYEAKTFLEDADLLISAPYTKGTVVPVAYITSEGVFAGANPVAYTVAMEKLNLGGLDSEQAIDGVTSITGNVPVLKNVKYSQSSNLGGESDMDTGFLDYHDSTLFINIGVSTLTELVIKNLPTGKSGSIIIADNNAYEKEDKSKTNSIGTLSGTLLSITGNTSATLFTKDFVTKLSSEENWSKLSVFTPVDIPEENIYGVIYPKYPSNRRIDIHFKGFSPSDGYDGTVAKNRNIFKMTVSEQGAFNSGINYIEGSLVPSDISPVRGPIGFNSMNAGYTLQDSIGVYARKAFTTIPKDAFTPSCYPPVTLEGGERNFESGEADSSNALYNLGWKEALSEAYHNVDIFFESCPAHKASISEAKSSSVSTDKETSDFYTLANTHDLSGYIFNRTVDPTVTNYQDTIEKLNFGYNYWNISNIAIINIDGYNILSPMTGKRAGLQARIIAKRYGGVAPMFLNDSENLGGELHYASGELLGLVYSYDKHARDFLDSKNYNPAVFDSSYGVIVTGQKTCKYGELTDWSYIGHVCSFLEFQKEVYNDVMFPQIGKPNNDFYRHLRAQQVETKLRRRLEGAKRIWAGASVDTSTNVGVNDANAMRERKFIINVRVKVDVYSEYVELNFTNLDQTMSV